MRFSNNHLCHSTTWILEAFRKISDMNFPNFHEFGIFWHRPPNAQIPPQRKSAHEDRTLGQTIVLISLENWGESADRRSFCLRPYYRELLYLNLLKYCLFIIIRCLSIFWLLLLFGRSSRISREEQAGSVRHFKFNQKSYLQVLNTLNVYISRKLRNIESLPPT